MTEDMLTLIKENVIQGRVAKDDEGFDEGMAGQPGVSELVEEAITQGISPGDIIKLEAKTKFSLLIGNAGGIILTYEGETLDSLGESEEVVRINLPR